MKMNLKQAFPSYLREDVVEVLEIMPNYKTNGDYFTVKMYGGTIRIPERIYCDELPGDVISNLTERQKKIIFCLYLRHYDGFVREKNLSEIFCAANIEKWVLPYILRLIGEYVVEILEEINRHIDMINNRTLYTFINDNPKFYMRQKSRISSYWDCYYRDKYPIKEEYVGFKILQSIQMALDK